MLLEKIKTPGLSHLSYVIGSGGEAAVIDPRRDCGIYIEVARAASLKITHIFETHRNEDLVSGASVLARWTGARVLHGPNTAAAIAYAETIRDGDRFALGELDITALETPGHTDDHLSFAVFDRKYPKGAVGVFTGDALFVGDVGRTDFYPQRSREVAGLLFDSLRKILTLGDQAILWPAHGAGSVCGSGMAEREFSTLGHERTNNPRLLIPDREAFIEAKVNEKHYQPPYFRLMERLNMQGGAAPPRTFRPRPLSLGELAKSAAVHVIDIREPLAFASGHFPRSFCIPVSMLPAFAGWFVRVGDSIVLVADDAGELQTALEHLVRIALDNVEGGYIGVVPAAEKGHLMAQLPMICTAEVERRLNEASKNWCLLDVRDANERAESAIEDSKHIYVGELNERWRELDRAKHYTVMCASGMRATVAASWLATRGFENLDVYLGSMGAWTAHRAA